MNWLVSCNHCLRSFFVIDGIKKKPMPVSCSPNPRIKLQCPYCGVPDEYSASDVAKASASCYLSVS
jgi:hypothetical protein